MHSGKLFGDKKVEGSIILSKKWLNVNKELAFRKIINCTNRTHIRNVGKYLESITNGKIRRGKNSKL
jgi:hypothetical protein